MMSQILIDNCVDKNGVQEQNLRLVFIYLCKNDMHTLKLRDFINKIGTSLSACKFSKKHYMYWPCTNYRNNLSEWEENNSMYLQW